MGKTDISLACDLNDLTRALHDGTLRPTGINLGFLPLQVEEPFWRIGKHGEFDATEIATSSCMMTRDQGRPDIIAIPVFPSRNFRHSCLFVNADAGIDGPADLVGKRVGVLEYQMTAALWIQGTLQHEGGVHPARRGGSRASTRSVFLSD